MRSFLAAITLGLSSSAALAGGMSTGGGSAVVCRDASGQITKAIFLDVFEGRERFGYDIPERNGEPSDLARAALANFAAKPAYRNLLEATLTDIETNRVLLPAHLALQTSTDLGNDYAVYILAGCRLEQVGFYESDGKLRVATSVYDHLSPTSQAAFWLHETIYRFARDTADAPNSGKARPIVAMSLTSLVAGDVLIRAMDDVVKETHAVFVAHDRPVDHAPIVVSMSCDTPSHEVPVYAYDAHAHQVGAYHVPCPMGSVEIPSEGVVHVQTEIANLAPVVIHAERVTIRGGEVYRGEGDLNLWIGWQPN
jgi:hypothetical protein